MKRQMRHFTNTLLLNSRCKAVSVQFSKEMHSFLRRSVVVHVTGDKRRLSLPAIKVSSEDNDSHQRRPASDLWDSPRISFNYPNPAGPGPGWPDEN